MTSSISDTAEGDDEADSADSVPWHLTAVCRAHRRRDSASAAGRRRSASSCAPTRPPPRRPIGLRAQGVGVSSEGTGQIADDPAVESAPVRADVRRSPRPHGGGMASSPIPHWPYPRSGWGRTTTQIPRRAQAAASRLRGQCPGARVRRRPRRVGRPAGPARPRAHRPPSGGRSSLSRPSSTRCR